MNKRNISNIIFSVILLLYCSVLQYNVIPHDSYTLKDDAGRKYFIEFQNTGFSFADYKMKLRVPAIDNAGKVLNLFTGGSVPEFTFLNLLESRILNFISLLNNNYIFNDYRICFPFHYFF